MSIQFWDWLYAVAEKAVASFNLFEAVFWLAVAAGFLRAILLYACKSVKVWTLAALLLALFGLSDLVEVSTGAWWRPWWLLLWKGLCLLSLIALYLWHRRPTAAPQPCRTRDTSGAM